MGLFLSNPALTFFFFFLWSSCVKLEQESILMVWRSTDIVSITTGGGGGVFVVFLKTSLDLSLPTRCKAHTILNFMSNAFWLPGLDDLAGLPPMEHFDVLLSCRINKYSLTCLHVKEGNYVHL